MDVFWLTTVLETGLISLSAPLGTSSLHSPCRASILLHPQMRWHCAGHLMGRTCSSRVWHPVWSGSGNSTCKRQEESEPSAVTKLSHLLAIQTIRIADPVSVNSGESENSHLPS